MVNDLVPRRRGEEELSKKNMEQCDQSVEDEVGWKEDEEDEEEKGNNEDDNDEDEANWEDNIIFEAEEEDDDLSKGSIFVVMHGSLTWLLCILVSGH